MKRIITLSILSCIALLLILTVATGVFLATLDLNHYKKNVENIIEKATGRHIVFEGNFTHSLFPLGLKTGRAYIFDEDIYGADPFLKVEELSLKVDLAALFHGEVVIDELNLSGLTAKLATSATGKNNWEIKNNSRGTTSTMIIPLDETREIQENTAPSFKDFGAKRKFNARIRSITASNASITYINLQNKNSWILENTQVRMTNLGENTDMALSLSGDLLVNTHSATVGLDASIRFSNDNTMQVFISSCKLLDKEKRGILPEISASASLLYDANLDNLSINDLQGSFDKTSFSGVFAIMLPNSPNLEYSTSWDVRGELQLGDIFFDDFSKKITVLLGNTPSDSKNRAISEALKIKAQNIQKPPIEEVPTFTTENLFDANNVDSNPIIRTKISQSLAKGFAIIDTKIDSIEYKSTLLKNISIKSLLSKGKSFIPFTFFAYGGDIQGSAKLSFLASAPLSWELEAITKNCKVELLPFSMAKRNQLTGTLQVKAFFSGKELSTNMLSTATGSVDVSMEGGRVHGLSFVPKELAPIYSIPDTFPLESASFSATVKKGIASTSNIKILSPLLTISGQGKANIVKNAMAIDLDVDASHSPVIPLLLRGGLTDPSISINIERLKKRSLKKTIESGDLKKMSESDTKALTKKLSKVVEKGSKKIIKNSRTMNNVLQQAKKFTYKRTATRREL